MRKYFLPIIISISVLGGCTKDFKEANTDPTTAANVPAGALLTKGLLDVSGYDYATWRANFIYTTLFVQQFASTQWRQGDRYFYDEGYSSAQWGEYFPAAIKGLTNLVNKTTGNADEVNYNSAGRILKVIAFMRLTDLYGDIPYVEASKGYTDGVLTPAYDPQQTIYSDLLKELEEAATAFDASKPMSGDISAYGGDAAKWKKAAYSLMLRLAMRLSKIDENTAKTWVAKAVSGGLISSYAESFRINHLEGTYDNPNSHILGYYNGARGELKSNNFKVSKTFYDKLKNALDPRLKIWFVIANTPDNNTPLTEDDDPLIQKPLPNGLEAAPDPINTYSELRSKFVDPNDPHILISHSQTLLLQAEAVERGWTTGTAATLFHDGILSAINQLKLYAPGEALFNDAANTLFANATPYAGTQAQKLEAINTQYWIASFLDGHESFANWRRTGYPSLTPVNFPGNYTGGVIPRRLQYPSGETGINKANYDAAVARQGADNFVTRVWWDKQ